MERFRALYTPITYSANGDGNPFRSRKVPPDSDPETVLVIAILSPSEVVFIHGDGRLDTDTVECFTQCISSWRSKYTADCEAGNIT